MAANRRIPRLRYKLWHLMVAVGVLAGVFAVVSWWINDPVGAAGFRLRYGWASARVSAASDFGDMGSDGRTAVALARGLRDGELAVRQGAAQSLARIPPSGEPSVLDALGEALSDEDAGVRQHVLIALGRQGPRAGEAVPQIAKLLDDERSGVRLEAAAALGAICREPSAAVPALVGGLRDESAELRLACAKSLASFGADARDAVPALIERLDDADRTMQNVVKRTLISVGPNREQTLLLVQHGQGWLVGEVARRGQIDGATLSEVLRQEDRGVRAAVVSALGDDVGREGAGAAGALVELLEDENADVRRNATRALARLLEMGVAAETARPALVELLDEEDWRLSLEAAEALWKDQGDVAMVMPTLLRGFKVKEPLGRIEACLIVGAIGPPASKAVPVLADALQDRSARFHAVYALKAMGREAAPAVAALVDALDGPESLMCRAAALALGEIGPQAHEAVPALREALAHREAHVREAAEAALRAIEETGKHESDLASDEEVLAKP